MTLYELALQRGTFIAENMVSIERDDRVYLFVWIRHAPKSRTNHAYLGAGVNGLDREVWQILAECVSDTFAVLRDAEPCLPIVKHAATRISWELSELPKGKLELLAVLRDKKQTEFDNCAVDLTFEKLIRYVEKEWIPSAWVDVSPVALYTLYLLLKHEANRTSIACAFHGLHSSTLRRVDIELARSGSVTRDDIDAFVTAKFRGGQLKK